MDAYGVPWDKMGRGGGEGEWEGATILLGPDGVTGGGVP